MSEIEGTCGKCDTCCVGPCDERDRLRVENERFRSALEKVHAWEFDFMGDCVADARAVAASALCGSPDTKKSGRSPVLRADGVLENFLLSVEGKRYRCACGCNVFHKPDDTNVMQYKCNSCGVEFEGE